jgi:hypothetical protein
MTKQWRLACLQLASRLALVSRGPCDTFAGASASVQLGGLAMRTDVRIQPRAPPLRLVHVDAYYRQQNGCLVFVKEHWRRWPSRSAKLRA